MKIITGNALVPSSFFAAGSSPTAQGSSFDLAIGHIFDDSGNAVTGPFVLKPGHMVQVVSAEVFNLPDNVTGHVTYKTGLTRTGIWALTVGIVDPGWDGPIATTLLNFSRVDHTIHVGDSFLRVTLFEHAAVPATKLRKSKPLPAYLREVQSLASSSFPTTFLNSDKLAADAAKSVMDQIRNVGLVWFGATAILFGVIQVMAPTASRLADGMFPPAAVDSLKDEISGLQARIVELEKRDEQPSSGIVPPAEPPSNSDQSLPAKAPEKIQPANSSGQ